MIIVEGLHSVHIAAPASLVTEDRELAWAEPFVIKNPAFAWVLGKFVGTGSANLNGHIFDVNELATARQSVVYAPMNMLHSAHQIMGTYVANELVYPTGENAAVAEVHPYLEALAVFWKFYFPEAFVEVEKAHQQGALAWSMECVPESVTCAGGCDQTFPYMGRQDPSYCDHLNKPAAAKRLNKPHFTAGALVIPPASPAWKNATVTELSSFVRRELEAASGIYEQTAADFPHLGPAEWEAMMGELLVAAGNPFTKGPDKKDGPEKKAGPHAYAPRFPGSNKAPCKVCGKPADSPMHAKPKAKATEVGEGKLNPAQHLRMMPHVYTPDVATTGPVPEGQPCALCGEPEDAQNHQKESTSPPGTRLPKITAGLDPVLAAIAATAARSALEEQD